MRFIMMCGLPASGKSTITKDLAVKYSATLYSSDELRKELFGSEDVNDNNSELFAVLHSRIKNDMACGKSVIYDATNISSKRRKTFLELINKYGAERICYLIATPYEKCILQNETRDRKVPAEVIRKMYINFNIPQKYEGWDDIQVVWNMGEKDWSIDKLLDVLDSFDQENPHHSLTLGQHIRKCFEVLKSSENEFIKAAALLHDIGKPFTKTYTDVAHYYQHNLVGAYNALFYLKSSGYKDKQILEICNYIQWHMQPYFLETDKSRKKFIDLVGQEFYDNLLLLHQADKEAH